MRLSICAFQHEAPCVEPLNRLGRFEFLTSHGIGERGSLGFRGYTNHRAPSPSGASSGQPPGYGSQYLRIARVLGGSIESNPSTLNRQVRWQERRFGFHNSEAGQLATRNNDLAVRCKELQRQPRGVAKVSTFGEL